MERRPIHAPCRLQRAVTTPWLLGMSWLPTCHFGSIACFGVPQVSQFASAHPSEPPRRSFESSKRSGCRCSARAVAAGVESTAPIVIPNRVRMWLHGVAHRLFVCCGSKVSDSWSWAGGYVALVGGCGARFGSGRVVLAAAMCGFRCGFAVCVSVRPHHHHALYRGHSGWCCGALGVCLPSEQNLVGWG